MVLADSQNGGRSRVLYLNRTQVPNLLLRFEEQFQLCLGALTDNRQMTPDGLGVNKWDAVRRAVGISRR